MLLTGAHTEIEMLRKEVATLRPQADAYLRISQVLVLAGRNGNSASRDWMASADLNFDIRRAMETLHREMCDVKTQSDPGAGDKQPWAQSDKSPYEGAAQTAARDNHSRPIDPMGKGHAGVDLSGATLSTTADVTPTTLGENLGRFTIDEAERPD